MQTQLTQVIAVQRIEEFRRTAASRVVATRGGTPNEPATARMLGECVTLRLAGLKDSRRLTVLAELDSTRLPGGPMLLAEVGGQLVAAIGLEQGAVIADPFHPTLEVVKLLHARARQLSCDERSVAWPRRWVGSRRRMWASR